MTNEEAKLYIKENGKFPPGRVRCMDCRCSGKGECGGETLEQLAEWNNMMQDEMDKR